MEFTSADLYPTLDYIMNVLGHCLPAPNTLELSESMGCDVFFHSLKFRTKTPKNLIRDFLPDWGQDFAAQFTKLLLKRVLG